MKPHIFGVRAQKFVIEGFMSNKTAIVVDRWVAERVWELCEHDDVGMVFDGVDGVLARDDGDSDSTTDRDVPATVRTRNAQLQRQLPKVVPGQTRNK